MKKLLRIEYNNNSKEVLISDSNYNFKKGEESKVFPVSLKGNDLKHPDSFVFYYDFDNYSDRFNEAKNDFYSLDVNFDNFDYIDLQKHSIKINKN